MLGLEPTNHDIGRTMMMMRRSMEYGYVQSVMVMMCYHPCDMLVTDDDGDEHTGDTERVRRCD